MSDFFSVFFSVLWGTVSGLVMFIFYIFIVFVIFSIPLKFIAKKLFVSANTEPSKALSVLLIVLMLLPGVLGAFLYVNQANIVKPFTAKLFNYPATEIIITFPNKIKYKQSEKLQKFFLDYFNGYSRKLFEGGSTYVRGNQFLEKKDGVIPHYWKFQEDKLHIFLSNSLSKEETSDLLKTFNIWFPKSKPVQNITDVVSLSMNPESESVLFALLFKKKNLSRLPIKDQLRLYSNKNSWYFYLSEQEKKKPAYYFHERYVVNEEGNSKITIDPKSLTFRMSGFDVFEDGGAHAPIDTRCYAAFDIKQGIWEKELLKSAETISTIGKQISLDRTLDKKANEVKAFSHFYNIRFKALLSNGKNYDAYIYSYPTDLSNGSRTSEMREDSTDFKYAQILILSLKSYDTIYQGNKEKCLTLVKTKEPLYSSYINNMMPNDITGIIESVNIFNKKFSPFYHDVEKI